MSTQKPIKAFQQLVWDFYAVNKRMLPWRETTDPYAITVSEIMLQQTQVERVLPKYLNWMHVFADWQVLAAAPLAQVLRQWQGLGYNRRAKFLHLMAKAVVEKHEGAMPPTLAELKMLPGIGNYTAQAILAFAFNEPVTLIETNVRTVFLYHFFPNEEGVSDAQLLPLVKQSVPEGKARDWYNALMDYGTYLKKEIGNQNKRSMHYAKQSDFITSKRRIRGAILRELATQPLTLTELLNRMPDTHHDMAEIVEDLQQEGLIEVKKNLVCLPQG